MNGELFGVGRGYLFAGLVLVAATAMVFTGDIEADKWLGFAQWLVPLVIAAKESGKVLSKFGTNKNGGTG